MDEKAIHGNPWQHSYGIDKEQHRADIAEEIRSTERTYVANLTVLVEVSSSHHCTQHTAHNTQHTAHNTQHSTQHTAHSTQHAAHNIQHTTHSTQHSTQHTAH